MIDIVVDDLEPQEIRGGRVCIGNRAGSQVPECTARVQPPIGEELIPADSAEVYSVGIATGAGSGVPRAGNVVDIRYLVESGNGRGWR